MFKGRKKNASRWPSMLQNPFAAVRSASFSDRDSADEPTECYFAYGSNLDVAQMARRCPGSALIGQATLHGYRWQINDRGVANVVPVKDGKSSKNGVVEGLLYSVTCDDEEELDRCEGVSYGLYEKFHLPVQVVPHPHYAYRPTAAVSDDLSPRLGGGGHSRGSGKGRPLLATPDANAGTATDRYEAMALVYISTQFTKDGPIREEYVGRMRTAIRYAVALGVSQAFVDRTMVPCLGRGAKGKKRGRDAPTGPRTVDSSGPVVQDGRPTEPDCAVAGCDHRGRLCRLRTENRQPHRGTGIRFHTDVLLCQIQRMAEYEAGAADKDASPPVYVVVLQEPLVGSEASYSIEAATQSLPLANELAMKHFRDACARYCGSGIARDAVIGPPVAAQQDLGEESGKCGCFLDSNCCFFFVVTLSEGGGQIRVWVTVQELLVE